MGDDLEMLRRLLRIDETGLSPEFAREVLKWEPSPADQARLHELSAQNQEGELTPAEQAELASYLRAGRFLDLLRSKARLALRRTEALR